MPQLVKGGKYVFGWTEISPDGCIRIPPEAASEYSFSTDEKVFILSGSKTSGGFSINRESVISKVELFTIIERNDDLRNFRTGEGIPVKEGNRYICWTTIRNNGTICLPVETLKKYGVNPGDRLAVGRGSYVGVSMLAKGRIVEEALKHPELAVFNS